MSSKDQYEIVVGLEVHAQLLTKSKLFCGDSTEFGAAPNTQVSAITLAHPGTLPKMNRKAVEFAVKMGLACNSEIETNNYFARKNYFYPDLPKGYQVSQHTTPICKAGFITIQTKTDTKKIRLTRIHLEEDAGKSLHDIDINDTCIDYNRAGTALIEIVSEPDIRSGEEAYAYLTEIRKLVRYLEICDGNMEEGSLRCDANISVRKTGEMKLGTRVEVKNLNSIRNVKRAIEIESQRLIAIIEKGGEVQQQTRSFDANNGNTFSIREKEDADDYRYFPEPDLTPFDFDHAFIEKIRESIPALPGDRIKKYATAFNLSVYDANILTEERSFSDYFEVVVKHTSNYKAAANWMLGPVKTWLNEKNKGIEDFPIDAEKLAKTINLTESGKISFSIATTKLFSKMLNEPQKDPSKILQAENLATDTSETLIEPLVDQVLQKFAGKVAEYRNGKKGLLALFVGEVIKLSKGKADPSVVNKLVNEKLKK